MEIYHEQPIIDLKIEKIIKRDKLGKIKIKGNNPSSRYLIKAYSETFE